MLQRNHSIWSWASSLILLVAFFQNCSKVDFKNDVAMASSKSLTEKDAELDVSNPPQGAGPLDMVVLLDDSKSNISNVQRMLTGLEDLVRRLDSSSPEPYEIHVYTIGRANDSFPLQKYAQKVQILQSSPMKRKIIMDYLAQPPLATLSQRQEQTIKDAFFSKIRTHLNSRLNAAAEADSAPNYLCGLLAYMHERNSSGAANRRHVVIAVSDEDLQSAPKSLGCPMEYEIIQTVTGQRKAVNVPLEVLRPLEGGGEAWNPTSLSFINMSCAEVLQTGGLVDQQIARQAGNLRRTATSESNCREATEDVWTQDNSTPQLAFFGAKTNFTDQWTELQKIVPKTNFFFGGFLVTTNGERTNDDQKVGQIQIDFGRDFFSPLGNKIYPIASARYGDFVSDVLVFSQQTRNPVVDLRRVGFPSGGTDHQVIRLLAAVAGQWKELRFSQNGDQLFILEQNIDFSQTVRLQIHWLAP